MYFGEQLYEKMKIWNFQPFIYVIKKVCSRLVTTTVKVARNLLLITVHSSGYVNIFLLEIKENKLKYYSI